MPTTKFKLVFGTKKPDIEKFKQSLPSTFNVYVENKIIYLSLNTTVDDDENARYLVERELDRYFFLTCIKITAEMIKKRKCLYADISYRIQSDLPDDIKPQNWNYELPIMLKLWSMAVDLHNEVHLQILYFFHIIELAYPTNDAYQDYTDYTTPPHPLTECKFIRHLIAHAGDVDRPQLKKYCKYLGIPEVMFDVTDRGYQSILLNKVKLLKKESRKAIEKYL